MVVSENEIYTQIATLMENMTINHWILGYPIFRQTHMTKNVYFGTDDQKDVASSSKRIHDQRRQKFCSWLHGFETSEILILGLKCASAEPAALLQWFRESHMVMAIRRYQIRPIRFWLQWTSNYPFWSNIESHPYFVVWKCGMWNMFFIQWICWSFSLFFQTTSFMHFFCFL